MPKLKSVDIVKMSDEDLYDKLSQIRAELMKLKSAAARGALKKESGEISLFRTNIARLLTVMRSRNLKIRK